MNKMFKFGIAALVIASAIGCSRIESGTVGVRVNASKEIQGSELQVGSWNQTIIGDVLEFPVRDLTINLENKTPLTADNSALADFDVTVVYGINPASVAEIYTKKSKAFHAYDRGDIYLMYNYVSTLVNNASYKAVRGYKSLEVADNRQKIEGEIRDLVTAQLKSEGLDTSITLTVVQVRNVTPNAAILAAATEYVRSQNEILIKSAEVKVAKLEAERMAALSINSQQSIAYMNAQANVIIANAVKDGKISTILIPHGMTVLGSLK
jgi:regulator of protease activity HflC (stomatin/prohibitin superfamily)